MKYRIPYYKKNCLLEGYISFNELSLSRKQAFIHTTSKTAQIQYYSLKMARELLQSFNLLNIGMKIKNLNGKIYND